MQLDIEPAQKLVIRKRTLESPVNTKAINISLTSQLENNTNITTKVDNETNEVNVIREWSQKSPVYTRAIRISLTSKLENKDDITNMVYDVAISGCPSAILTTGELDSVSETWTMERSENVLKTRPYLHVVAMSMSIQLHFSKISKLNFPQLFL